MIKKMREVYNKAQQNYAIYFLLGLILGAIVFMIVYGVKVLNPTYDGWLLANGGDLSQHYIGWQFYRHTPWQFPIGMTEGLTPEKISVMYTDSIPIFAIFFKILSPILPETFQYFGIWGIMCFMLQGGFGAIIIRKFSDSIPFCMFGTVFFTTSSVVLQRMFGHTALAGNWVILVGITLWIYNDEIQIKWKKVLAWCGIASVASLVHPYFVPMIFILMLCCMLQTFLKEKKIIFPIVAVSSAAALVIVTMFIEGAFYGSNNSFSAGGLGIYSTNLNAFFNPWSSTNSKYLKPLPLATGGQGEGFSYLGLGMLLMCFLSVIIIVKYIIKNGIRNSLQSIKDNYAVIIPFILAIAGSMFIAISPTATLYSHTIYDIKYPQHIITALSIFRASGRFCWITFYIINTAAIAVVAKKVSKKRIALLIISVCMIIQVSDYSILIKALHQSLIKEQKYVSSLKSDEWDKLAEGRNHIIFMPLEINYLGNRAMYFEFANYANDYHMTLSSFYVARISYEFLHQYAEDAMNDIKSGNADDETIYVFTKDFDANQFKSKNFVVENVDGYTVGYVNK